MSQNPFVIYTATFEIKVYNGRLYNPLDEQFSLYIYDAFSRSWLDNNMLRDGEHIHIVDAKKIQPK